MAQAKGSATRIILDWEASYNTPRSDDRVPVRIPFNTTDLKGSRSLQQAATIRGDRNPAVPFQGNKDVGGNLVTPVDPRAFGYLLCMLMGYPVTSIETPYAFGSGGSDYKEDVPLTITIDAVGSAGHYTLSAAQDAGQMKVGDRIIYEKSGTRHVAWVTTHTDLDEGVVKDALAGGTAMANITGATVVAIMNNRANSTPGTVTISGGAAVFSATQANLAAGQMLIYGATHKIAYIETVTDTTHATVIGPGGTDIIADASTQAVEFLGAASQWTHTFKVDPTASVPSAVMEIGYQDLAVPYFDLFQGLKVNTLEITVGGDGELTASWGIVGADNNGVTTAEDAYDGDAGISLEAVPLFTTRFEQRHAYVKEGGSTATSLGEFRIALTNALDTSSFVIGGGGVRDDLPEGIFGAGGSLTALFRDTTILDKAKNGTETSLEIGFVRDQNSLAFLFPEVLLQDNSVAIPGPAGIRLPLDFQAFYGNSTQESAVVITLVNDISDFALAVSV